MFNGTLAPGAEGAIAWCRSSGNGMLKVVGPVCAA